MAPNTLNASKTPGIIVAEIKMMASTFKGSHFLVEGDSDSKFWKPRLCPYFVSIVNCEGKENLLGASAIVKKTENLSVAGIYDSDFEKIFGITHHPEILTPTDHNDLELTLIASGALDTLLHEFGDADKIAEFEATNETKIAQHLELTSRHFGELRYLNETLGHKVDFDRLSPYRFVSSETWIIDRAGLISEYAKLSNLSPQDVDRLIQTHCPKTPAWQLSQGHDAVRILAQGLRRRIGRRQISEPDVARVLRIAFSTDFLQQSCMYKALHEIQKKLAFPLFN